jgi:hypothetical protein
MPTIRDLIVAVRNLAKAHPDNIYQPSLLGKQCFYDKGWCTDGSVGCIFGQALVGLDILVTGSREIYVVSNELFSDADRLTRDWCQAVQTAQDASKTWGEAVSCADEDYPDLKEIVP